MKKKYLACLLLLSAAIASCKKEEIQPEDGSGISFKLTTAPSKAVLTSDDGVNYQTTWQKGDKIAAFFDNGAYAEFSNVLEDGPLAEFQGTVTAPEKGTIRTFYPSSAYVAYRSAKDVDVRIAVQQHPLTTSIDPAADLLVCRPAEYETEGGVASAHLLSFDRLTSVLRLKLTGEVSGKKVQKLRLYVPSNYSLAGVVNLTLENAALKGVSTGSNYVEAVYDGTGLDIANKQIFFSTIPITIASGSKLRLLAYTSDLCIDKSFELTSDMVLPAGNIAHLNVSITNQDCKQRTDALVIGEDIQLYSASKTNKSYIDFQSGKTYSKNEFDALAAGDKQQVDMGPKVSGGAYRFENVSGKTYKTRFSKLDMTGDEYMSIVSRTAINFIVDEVEWDNEHAPTTTEYYTETPAYFAVKTYTPDENNQYGILEVVSYDATSVTFNYKLGKGGGTPEYSGARTVTISGGRMYVDGQEFYVNGAAATMQHTRMADYGANVCRTYSSGVGSGTFLDRLYEKGLMSYLGLPARQYGDFAPGEKTYDDAEYRAARIDSVMEIVNAVKDHPALLCYSLGNELEGQGNASREGLYKYYGELCAAIRKVDTKHPVTAAFTEAVAKAEIELVLQHCSDLDFLCFNSYYSYLKKYEKGASTDFTQYLEYCGWTKPFMITEYGPTGTWNRTSDDLYNRINNDWGALIQLSSDQAAQRYIDCYKLIKAYDNCLGSIAFWWGYQSHGQVLGWYPLMTKEYVLLTGVQALESCWKGIDYNPTAPKIMSWASSIELNGKNVANPEWSSTKQADKNPVVSPGQQCTAKVYATCRSGHPSSTLRYKWFIYKDCTYYHKSGDTDWTRVTWDDCESVYTPIGGHQSMDEDARAELFVDRTLAEVQFTAPTEAANYRLYCIVYDDYVNLAGTICLNFQVK